MCAHTGMFRLIRDLDVRLNFLPSPYMYWRGTNRPNNTVRYKHDEWLCVCENVLEVYVSLSNQHESIWTESLVKSPFRARCQSNPTANQGGFFSSFLAEEWLCWRLLSEALSLSWQTAVPPLDVANTRATSFSIICSYLSSIISPHGWMDEACPELPEDPIPVIAAQHQH